MNEIKRAAIYSPEEDSYGIGLAMTFIMDHGLTFSGLYVGKKSLQVTSKNSRANGGRYGIM